MSRVVSGARGTKEKDGVLVIAGSRPLERNTLRSRDGPGLTGSLEDRRRAGPLCLRSPEALCRSLGWTAKEEGSFKGRTGWTRETARRACFRNRVCYIDDTVRSLFAVCSWGSGPGGI